MTPVSIVKRDGSTAAFDVARIVDAIERAQCAVGMHDSDLAVELAEVVVDHLAQHCETDRPDIEAVQDSVIYVLQESGNYDIALAYLRYRDARERERRRRGLDQGDGPAEHLNLHVLGRDGRRRSWDRAQLAGSLTLELGVAEKAAEDVARATEAVLAESPINEITAPLLLSAVDTALLRCGLHAVAEERAPLRLDRQVLRDVLGNADGAGLRAVLASGTATIEQLTLAEAMPPEVARLYASGRLWVDGLGDPLRGSQYTAALDGNANPWQILTQAYSESVAAQQNWRDVRMIIPPIILGHLERGAEALIEPLEHLAHLAQIFLYCDGRTPLLDEWPFRSKRISIASYAEDFLLLRRLQELGLEHQSGPHLMQGGFRKRVAVRLALNAQGLEDQFTQMDHLAMGLVAAASMRQRQASRNRHLAGADIRFAIYGLPPNSPSNDYFERQVVQEGLRNGIAMSRTTTLPPEACEHLGRLFT